ncbi:hypothetical protein PU630_14280 [Microbacterium horticulturae]|uniref:Uncharacterized protein n=1 Tax=Microbacterium horticulturae TaxID=3028316 RepID=A0ABY8BW30_9MICO|nr:hypothetical protein [Microbacterium sp. KACC 23027]WEG08394.1 hypothetical protein PU630_14280 [Microbacterium sp. KACC 23027]
MTLTALRADALSTTPGGFELRLSLPWIRALPLQSLHDVAVQLDGTAVGDLRFPDASERWWPAQDRVVLRGGEPVAPGPHDVIIDFALLVPYLQMGPDGPLRLPFHEQRTLQTDAALTSVSEDIA